MGVKRRDLGRVWELPKVMWLKPAKKPKSSPVLLERVVPQPVPAALARGATNSDKMAISLLTALRNHQWLCRVSCAMKCCSGEFHGEASWASAGLGLLPALWPSFLSPISSSPCLLPRRKHTRVCAREIS